MTPFEKTTRDGGGFIHNGRLMMTQTSSSPLPHTYFDWLGPDTVLPSLRLLSRLLDRHEFNLYNALLVRMSTQNCRFRSQGTGISHQTSNQKEKEKKNNYKIISNQNIVLIQSTENDSFILIKLEIFITGSLIKSYNSWYWSTSHFESFSVEG